MKLSHIQRLEAALKYKNGEGTYDKIAKEYRINLSSLQEIVSKYESLGKKQLLLSILKLRLANCKYTLEKGL